MLRLRELHSTASGTGKAIFSTNMLSAVLVLQVSDARSNLTDSDPKFDVLIRRPKPAKLEY